MGSFSKDFENLSVGQMKKLNEDYKEIKKNKNLIKEADKNITKCMKDLK